MFVALRDLACAKGRFLLMGLVVALVACLSFKDDGRPTFRSSLVDHPMWEAWQARPGVGHAAH